jgi:hypothetical protein
MRAQSVGNPDLQPPRIDPTSDSDLRRSGLENRCTGNRTEGSSANEPRAAVFDLDQRRITAIAFAVGHILKDKAAVLA